MEAEMCPSRARRLCAALRRLFCAVLLIASSLLPLGTTSAGPVLAEAGAPIRAKDRSIDIPDTIAALRSEHVNTYLFQVWRNAGDWGQLPAFADAAKDAGIEVWVYLVPWSETPDKDPSFAYPEPFKTDYIAWADAIGKLSLDHPAITGWVMDDFYINAIQPGRFTDAYVNEMLAAGKSQNPNLKFFPVVYFQQPWADFVDRFARKIDGVIACYPRSDEEVDETCDYLNGNPYGPSLLASLSRKAKVKAGAEAVAVSQVNAPPGAHLRFYFDDQTFGQETGSHAAFVIANGRLLWSHQVDDEKQDTTIDLPLPTSAQGTTIRVGMRVTKPETGALVQVRLDDIRILTRDGARIDSAWQAFASPATSAELAPASPGGNLHLPLLLLVATLPAEHAKRYDEPPTVENIQRKLRLATGYVEQHKAAGVVCWYTPKTVRSTILPMVSTTFEPFDR
jgi:hypothetical protein